MKELDSLTDLAGTLRLCRTSKITSIIPALVRLFAKQMDKYGQTRTQELGAVGIYWKNKT